MALIVIINSGAGRNKKGYMGGKARGAVKGGAAPGHGNKALVIHVHTWGQVGGVRLSV